MTDKEIKEIRIKRHIRSGKHRSIKGKAHVIKDCRNYICGVCNISIPEKVLCKDVNGCYAKQLQAKEQENIDLEAKLKVAVDALGFYSDRFNYIDVRKQGNVIIDNEYYTVTDIDILIKKISNMWISDVCIDLANKLKQKEQENKTLVEALEDIIKLSEVYISHYEEELSNIAISALKQIEEKIK